jgi:hypothetical protein
MNVSEITNERLQFWASSTARLDDSDTAEKIAMARELLDRRGKVEEPAGKVEAHCPSCDWNNDRKCNCGYEQAKTPATERPEIEPSRFQIISPLRNFGTPEHPMAMNKINELVEWINKLKRRLEAVEREGK